MDATTGPRARIIGSGRCLPPRVVTNDDLALRFNTSDEWIRSRTGIAQRHHVDGTQGTSDLALGASVAALQDAGLSASDLDLIIFATLSPDYCFPGSGVLLGALLEIPGVPALDLRNQCSGFLYGLQCADGFIRSGIYRRILLVGAEVHSTGLDFSDRGRDVAVLFGDGAGAVILEAHHGDDGAGVIHTILGADGRHAELLYCKGGGSRQYPERLTPADLLAGDHYPLMEGAKVFKRALGTLRDVTRRLLETTGHSVDDVNLFIPHQANLRISELVRRELGVEPERFFNNIERYGNTTAASLPIALDECRRAGRLNPGDLLCMMAFGSGLTWGATLIRC